MTPTNRTANARDELTRAEQALGAARTLLDGGFVLDAITRAYYAAFHAARAMLVSRGVEPRTHSGAIHLLNVELVRQGLLDPRWNAILARLQRSRELADYDASVTFPAADAEQAIDDATRFLVEARAVVGIADSP